MTQIKDKFVLGIAELGILRILKGSMSRDRIQRSVLKLELAKSSGTVTDAIESLIKKRLVERTAKGKSLKSVDDFVTLTRAGKTMRRALSIGKLI
jgi:DNA-binding MarR family transcriptional regulator